ncbi:MAG: hypothetical protein AAB212_06320, partial [Bacteroidota bacterium]
MRKYYFVFLLTACTITHAQQLKYDTIDSILRSNAVKNSFSGVVLIAEKGKTAKFLLMVLAGILLPIMPPVKLSG